MEDDQVFPASQVNKKTNNSSFFKKLALILASFFLITILLIFSYLLGFSKALKENLGSEEISPTIEVTESPVTDSPTPSTSQKLTTPSSPSPNVKTKIISSQASLDGFRSSNGTGNSQQEIRVGRNINLVSRGLISFDLSNLPTKINIQSATLRIYQAQIVGNPYLVGNKLVIDHLTYGDALDSQDYGLPALISGFATLSESASIGWKEAEVTNTLKNDIANARSVSQYRFHFQKELTGGNSQGDFAYFESSENTLETKNAPQLVISYY